MCFEVMRGNNGRCHSYLVGGLLAMCLLLVCNWWSISSQNFELLRQIDNLSEELKINAIELDKCNKQKSLSEDRVRGYREGAAQQRVRIEQLRAAEEELRSSVQGKDESITKANKEVEAAQKAAKMCNLELESLKKLDISKDGTMATLRAEKTQLNKDIQIKQEEIDKLKEQLGKLKPPNGPIVKKMYDNLKKPEKVKEDNAVGEVIGASHDELNNQDASIVEEVKDAPGDNLPSLDPLEDMKEKERENEMAPKPSTT